MMKFLLRSAGEMLCTFTTSRLFHTSRIQLSSNKVLLAKLRKSTGYTFANCKRALDLNENDLQKAEEWLKKEALTMGWAKAAKLSGRATLQGLVGVVTDKNCGAMIELNCETDFVSRNKLFQDMAGNVLASCYNFAKQQNQFHDGICKVDLTGQQLRVLPGPRDKSLEDEIALLIAQIGENILIRRAICISVESDYRVAGYTHPTPQDVNAPLTGKYGSLLIYKASDDNNDAAEIGKQMCQHIIGMNPSKIGDPENDHELENKDDETCMIFQEFLMEPEVAVSQVLIDSGISLVEFVRYECGEDIDKGNVDESANIETGG